MPSYDDYRAPFMCLVVYLLHLLRLFVVFIAVAEIFARVVCVARSVFSFIDNIALTLWHWAEIKTNKWPCLK